MSSFLQRLADRSTGSDGALAPLGPPRPSLFEPEGGPGLGLGPALDPGAAALSPAEAGSAVGQDAGPQSGGAGSGILAPRKARGRVDDGVTSPLVVGLADEVAATARPVAAGWPTRLGANSAPELLRPPSRPRTDSAAIEPSPQETWSPAANSAPSADFLVGLTGRQRRATATPGGGDFVPPSLIASGPLASGPLASGPHLAELPLARGSAIPFFADPAPLGGPSRRAMRGTLGIAPLVDVPSTAAAREPVVHVTIGRIEVRSAPEKATKPRRARRPAAPRLSLDDYQRRRREGGR